MTDRQIFLRNKLSKSQGGFTLIEMLVAVLVLTIGLLGTAGLTAQVVQGNFFSKNITSATVIAQTQLESVQNKGYAGATTASFSSAAASVNMGGVSFSRTTTIAENSPASNMKTVTVTVTWNENNNVGRAVTLETILAQ
ncbi:MAG TPA: prepilin-type N-terminal cleavage/methylation domain-containing protein [Candidatus Binatia bacterium]|nr:prepilin-type N-terminal cleavage/methylation domain-containing protein [Candidatus Binatia bacterium]